MAKTSPVVATIEGFHCIIIIIEFCIIVAINERIYVLSHLGLLAV